MLTMFQWWPHKRKFHQRFYDIVEDGVSDQQGFQNTFSVSGIEAFAARTLLDSGKVLATSNLLMEEIFFGQWEKPNFREKTTQEPIESWPAYGYNYDVLIGGLYPDQKPVWEEGLKGYTLELAFPVVRANEMLKRVRELFDAEARKLKPIAATYRSGINIKFGKAFKSFLGQTTTGTSDGEDWEKGTIMFDFPTYRPTIGDQKRFNEEFCKLPSPCPFRPYLILIVRRRH
jgi:L-gulonolactone oxidase